MHSCIHSFIQSLICSVDRSLIDQSCNRMKFSYFSAYDKLTVFSPSSNVTGFVSMTVIAIRNFSIVANLSFLYKPNPMILGFDFPPQLLTTSVHTFSFDVEQNKNKNDTEILS